MEAILIGLVELIATIIELLFHLVIAVLRALGFSVAHLAEKPKEGEPRFSGKRLLIAFAPLVLIILLIVGMYSFICWRQDVNQAKRNATKAIVNKYSDKLAGQLDENGLLERHPAATLDAEDAWGNPLRVEYKENLTHQFVVVKSDGSDEKPDTISDISASRKVLRPKHEMARDIFGKVKGRIKGHDPKHE